MDELTQYKRKDFTPEQGFASLNAGYVSDYDRTIREHVTTHPIDNLPPEKPSDRDDGILVREVQKDGKTTYQIEVTIADVAGHIDMKSTLAKVAHERAFTVYRPWMNDPMFPDSLEKRMSLEHGTERLGMTVVIDLDEHFKPTHTELKRTIAHPDCADYEIADGRVQKKEPQFSLMNRIARGVVKNHFGGHGGRAWEEYRDEEQTVVGDLNEDPLSATTMVATFMLLANQQVANLFSKTTLPFLYRNFEEEYRKDNGTQVAYYSTDLKAHTEVQKSGLDGAYCHFTSPIRRGPDFFNSHMAHHVINVLTLLEDELTELYVDTDLKREDLHRVLWDNNNAPNILNATYRERPRIDGVSRTPEDIQKVRHTYDVVRDLLTNKLGQDVGHTKKNQLHHICEKALTYVPKLTKTQLEEYAKAINALNEHERDLQYSPALRSKMKHAQKLMRSDTKLTNTSVSSMTERDFSAQLMRAALTGKLDEKTLEQATQRIESGRFARSQDAFSIMLLAPTYDMMRNKPGFGDESLQSITPPNQEDAQRWRKLKRVMATAIKHDPSAVDEALNTAVRQGILPELKLEHEASEIDADEESLIQETSEQMDAEEQKAMSSVEAENLGHDAAQHIHRALIKIPAIEEGIDISAPTWSLGHDKDTAMQHARYFFLEHYAFGELRPAEHAKEPHKLYAELNEDSKARPELLADIMQSEGANPPDYRERTDPNTPDHVRSTVTISGGPFKEAINASGGGKDLKTARNKAIRRLLRNDRFRNAVSSDPILVLYPFKYLKQHASNKGWSIHKDALKLHERSRTWHEATLTIHSPGGGVAIYEGTGSRKVHAINNASMKALVDQGWFEGSDGGYSLTLDAAREAHIAKEKNAGVDEGPAHGV